MFNDQLAGAIADARTLARLDALSEALWKAWGAGGIGDEDASTAAALLSARRSVVRGDIKPVGIPPGRNSIFPPRRAQVPPDRPAAMLRRRQLAASGPMPPALAAKFTTAELAALRIVGDEVREKGCCARSLAEIAARAGCGRTSVQNAIRQAARLGLITIQERRREGDVNLPNVVRIVSREWTAWLKRGRPAQAAGVHPQSWRLQRTGEGMSPETGSKSAATRQRGKSPDARASAGSGENRFSGSGGPAASAREGSK